MLLEAKILNPVRIKLGKNSNFVMSDEVNKENCPINQGVMFSGHHYGFILIIDYNGKQKEISYPTQCRIDAVGLENKHLKVFEEGKYNPWVFTCDGILKSEASYNPYSRRDNEYIKECYDLDEKTSDGFTLQKKKF